MQLTKKLISVAGLLGLILSVFANNVSADPARIMVVGGAVSAGWEQPSFRMPLVNALVAQSCSFDMVGDQTLTTKDLSNLDTHPGKHFPSFDASFGFTSDAHWSPSLGDDTDHQAFANVLTDDLLNGSASISPIGTYISQYQPNFLLLQLGSRDLSVAIKNGISSEAELNALTDQIVSKIGNVIDKAFDSHQDPASLRVLLGNYVPYRPDHPSNAIKLIESVSDKFAQKLESYVEKRQDSRVLIVDVATGFDSVNMTIDGLIPHGDGEKHIADSFLAVLRGAGLCADLHAAIAYPSVGSVVRGESAVFGWSDNGLNIDSWRLYVGPSQDGQEEAYFDSGIQTGSNRNLTITGLPEDGSNVFLRLEYIANGVADFTLSSVISLAEPKKSKTSFPELTSPVENSSLSGGSATFKWNSNSTKVLQWWLKVGSSSGSSNYYDSGRIVDSGQASQFVNGLPENGSPIFVSLYYKKTSGAWEELQYEFSSSGSSNSEEINGSESVTVSSETGTSLTSESATFNWNTSVSGIRQWWFRVGSSARMSDYFDSGRIIDSSQRSINVGNLPTDGRKLYVSLYYKNLSGEWEVVDESFISATNSSSDSGSGSTDSSSSTSSTAYLVNPEAGTVLSGSSQVFVWDISSGKVSQWWFRAGSSVGASDYFDSGRISNANQRSITAKNLPTDGSAVYVSLFSKGVSSAWEVSNYAFKAANSANESSNNSGNDDNADAASDLEIAIVNPSNGSTLSGASTTFSWSASSNGVREWWFRAGSSMGASNYFDSGRITNPSQRSVLASNLPTNGSNVYISLHYKTTDNVWSVVRYTYKAATNGDSSSSGSSSGGSSSGGSSSGGSSSGGSSSGGSSSGGSSSGGSSSGGQPPALDLSKVKWLHTDVSNWSESANMSSVTVNSSNVCMNYDKTNSWSSRNIYNADLVGNAWVFIWNEAESVWYAATWEWLRPGQVCKKASAVNGEHIKRSPYSASSGWKPTSGETLYFMVSGLARTSTRNILARTRPVKVIWP